MPFAKGFGDLPCPLCGRPAVITLDLADLENLHCEECSNPFTVATVRALMDAWRPVLDWIDASPRFLGKSDANRH